MTNRECGAFKQWPEGKGGFFIVVWPNVKRERTYDAMVGIQGGESHITRDWELLLYLCW